MMNKLLRGVVCIMMCVMVCAAPHAWANDVPLSEYEIKAAFLYNFAKFTQWPASSFSDPDTPLKLCIVGNDPLSIAVASIKDKSVAGRKIEIEQHSYTDTLDACHIVFVSPSEKKHLAQILGSLRGVPMLTVGDTEGFAQSGGIINFTRMDSKIQFEINVNAMQRAGLQIGAQLLKLAKVVNDRR